MLTQDEEKMLQLLLKKKERTGEKPDRTIANVRMPLILHKQIKELAIELNVTMPWVAYACMLLVENSILHGLDLKAEVNKLIIRKKILLNVAQGIKREQERAKAKRMRDAKKENKISMSDNSLIKPLDEGLI